MAELSVERRRPNIWRWIVLLVILAVVVWALVEHFGGEPVEVIEERPVGALRVAPAASQLPGSLATTRLIAARAIRRT